MLPVSTLVSYDTKSSFLNLILKLMLTFDLAFLPLTTPSLVNNSWDNRFGEKSYFLNPIIATRLNHNGTMSLEALLNFISIWDLEIVDSSR